MQTLLEVDKPTRASTSAAVRQTFVTRRRQRLMIAFAIVPIAVLHLVLMRDSTFYSDDWTFIFTYSWSPNELVRPSNGHLPLLGHVLWNAIMSIAGIESYLPYRLMGLAFVAVTAAALAEYTLRRAGWPLALAVAIITMSLGSSFHALLWPIASLGLVSIAAIPVCLLALDSGRRTALLVVAALMFLSLSAGGYGLVLPAAVGVELLLRRRWRAAMALVFAPVAILSLWVVTAGRSGVPGDQPALDIARLLDAPSYVVQSLALGALSLTGQAPALASLAAGLFVAVLVWAIRRNGSVDVIRILTWLAAATSFAVLVRLARAGDAELGAPRYLAFMALPLLMVLIEALRGLSFRRDQGLLVVPLLGMFVASNLAQLAQAGRGFEFLGQVHRGQLAAIELAAEVIPGDFSPGTEGMQYVTAEKYLAAVDAWGSPAYPLAELPLAPEPARQAADQTFVNAGLVSVVARSASCAPVGAAVTSLELVPGETHVLVGFDAAELRARRFAEIAPAKPLFLLSAGSSIAVEVTADRAARPWTLEFTTPVGLCS